MGSFCSKADKKPFERDKEGPLPPLSFNKHHRPGTKFVSGDAVYYTVDTEERGRTQWGEAVVHKVVGEDLYQLSAENGLSHIGPTALSDSSHESQTAGYLHPDLSEVGVRYLCRRWDHETPSNPLAETERKSGYTLEQAYEDFGKDLQFAGATQAGLGPELCGITLVQLSEVMELDGYQESMSMYDVVTKLIKPFTRGTGRGYALNINQKKPRRASIMVSHAWGENYSEFVRALRSKDGGGTEGEEEAYWVCAMAIYQCEDIKDVTIASQLGPDVSRGPFATVLKQAQGMVAVMTPGANPYERMWCVLEVHVAVDLGVPVHLVAFRNTSGYGSDRVLNDAAIQHGRERCDSKAARCGNPREKMNDDERKIRALIEKSIRGYAVIDTAVEWVKAKYMIDAKSNFGGFTMASPVHPLLMGGYSLFLNMVKTSSAIADAIARISKVDG